MIFNFSPIKEEKRFKGLGSETIRVRAIVFSIDLCDICRLLNETKFQLTFEYSFYLFLR